MKIRLSVDVTENDRLYLSRLITDAQRTRSGIMTKRAVQEHLNAKLAEYFKVLSSDFWNSHSKPLTAEEARDASDAITYMRSIGKSDGEIRAWLFMQRARLHFAPKKIE